MTAIVKTERGNVLGCVEASNNKSIVNKAISLIDNQPDLIREQSKFILDFGKKQTTITLS